MMRISRRRFVMVTGAAFATPAIFAKDASMACGFNIIETPTCLLGSAAAKRSFELAAATGASQVALIPFLWQSGPTDPGIVLGDALPHERLVAGLQQAKKTGLTVIVKPHVWVPGHWAGQVAMEDDASWQRWFANYRTAIIPLARLAEAGGAATFIIGTELRESASRREWQPLIAELRTCFSRQLTYVAHGADEVERFQFWPMLDAVGVSLYPTLGRPDDPSGWRRLMSAEVLRCQVIASASRRPLWVGEIGLRSAKDATYKPWESAEEKAAVADGQLQAQVIECWLEVLSDARVSSVLVWRWFTDPNAGGLKDTDFTVQNKPAADLLTLRWH